MGPNHRLCPRTAKASCRKSRSLVVTMRFVPVSARDEVFRGWVVAVQDDAHARPRRAPPYRRR
jgi:hypothetical protein